MLAIDDLHFWYYKCAKLVKTDPNQLPERSDKKSRNPFPIMPFAKAPSPVSEAAAEINATNDVLLHDAIAESDTFKQLSNDTKLPPKKPPRDNSNRKMLFCANCRKKMLFAYGITKNKKREHWHIQHLSFEHGEGCNLHSRPLQKAVIYNVDDAVLTASDQLFDLATKWWNIVHNNGLKDSILDPKDKRFYGLFFLQLPIHMNAEDPESLFKSFDDTTKALDELRSFNVFHALTCPNPEEIQKIVKLVVLFIEDLKFVMRIHKLFETKVLFLGNIGFIAGGKKTQKLHEDCNDLHGRKCDPTTPFSVLIPIRKFRSLHVNDVLTNHHKYNIKRGEGVIFDGNVPHAGARSKSTDPLDNLALHIHIDNANSPRRPNELQLADADDPGNISGYSTSEDEEIPKKTKKRKTKKT
jgi:hypothetical protein